MGYLWAWSVFLASEWLHQWCWAVKQRRSLQEGNIGWKRATKESEKGIKGAGRNEDGGGSEVLEEAVIVFSLRLLPPTFSSHRFSFSFPRCSGRNTKQAAQALMIWGRLASSCSWLDPNVPHLIPVSVSVDSFTVFLFAPRLCLTLYIQTKGWFIKL